MPDTPPPASNTEPPIAIDEKGEPIHKRWWRTWSRRRKIIVGGLLVLIIGTTAWAAWPGHDLPVVGGKNNQKAAAPVIKSPLSGVAVTAAQAARPVTGVIIENSLEARPQSGLQTAGIVFEAIAEGGITRFLALYQDTAPDYIGPVRSLRPYYIDWAGGFDASIAHVGGSPDALAQIRDGGKDLDQFFNAGAYWRANSRPSPHDVYTNFTKLDALNQAKGYTSSQFNPWPRKDDKPLATPGAKAINLNISSAPYNVHYDYDVGNNTYIRAEGGVAHKSTVSEADQTGEFLHPKVVVVLMMNYRVVDSSGHSGYSTYGEGPLFIFQDGNVNIGTWAKSDRRSQFSFRDPNGNSIQLNAGQTWVSIVGAPEAVNYQP